MLARKPGGGWTVLGAPQDTAGNAYRVTWPLPLYASAVVDEHGPQLAWDQPLFVGIKGALGMIIEGIANVGEYTPEAPFDLAAWAAEYEAGTDVQAS
jgi:hypothetical protein